jgi:hypothetical protein
MGKIKSYSVRTCAGSDQRFCTELLPAEKMTKPPKKATRILSKAAVDKKKRRSLLSIPMWLAHYKCCPSSLYTQVSTETDFSCLNFQCGSYMQALSTEYRGSTFGIWHSQKCSVQVHKEKYQRGGAEQKDAEGRHRKEGRSMYICYSHDSVQNEHLHAVGRNSYSAPLFVQSLHHAFTQQMHVRMQFEMRWCGLSPRKISWLPLFELRHFHFPWQSHPEGFLLCKSSGGNE